MKPNRNRSFYRTRDDDAPWPDYFVEEVERHIVREWLTFHKPVLIDLAIAVVSLGIGYGAVALVRYFFP